MNSRYRSLEIYLIIRVGNQFGIAEIKTGREARRKKGINQLNTAAGRDHLGIYTKKFLFVNCYYPENNMLLAKERNIKVVELTNSTNEIIAPEDQIKLRTIVREHMNK